MNTQTAWAFGRATAATVGAIAVTTAILLGTTGTESTAVAITSGVLGVILLALTYFIDLAPRPWRDGHTAGTSQSPRTAPTRNPLPGGISGGRMTTPNRSFPVAAAVERDNDMVLSGAVKFERFNPDGTAHPSSRCTYFTVRRTRLQFVFSLVQLPTGLYRAYIIEQPSYGSRETAAIPTHRYHDRHGHFICWDTPVTTPRAMMAIVIEWAELTERYITTGENMLTPDDARSRHDELVRNEVRRRTPQPSV